MTPKEYSHTECFEVFGTAPRNTRWSWSGRSNDGKDVSVTLWQDRFEEKGRVYRSWQTDRPGEWKSRPEFVDLCISRIRIRRSKSLLKV